MQLKNKQTKKSPQDERNSSSGASQLSFQPPQVPAWSMSAFFPQLVVVSLHSFFPGFVYAGIISFGVSCLSSLQAYSWCVLASAWQSGGTETDIRFTLDNWGGKPPSAPMIKRVVFKAYFSLFAACLVTVKGRVQLILSASLHISWHLWHSPFFNFTVLFLKLESDTEVICSKTPSQAELYLKKKKPKTNESILYCVNSSSTTK